MILMKLFKTKKEKVDSWHHELTELRKEREKENKTQTLLDEQFNMQASKGVTSETDKKNLKRIAEMKLESDKIIFKILKKEESLAKKIVNLY